MPKKTRELRLVADAGRPAGLRLSKSVEMSGGDVYLVPLPDLFPKGVHFSFHRTGRIHLKGSDGRVLAVIDPTRLAAGMQTPAFDSALATVLIPPKGGRRAVGTISRPDALPDLSTGRSSPVGVRDVAVGRVPERMDRVEIENTDTLPEVFQWLRREGVLVQRGLVFLEVKGSVRAPIFLDLTPPDGSAYPEPPKKFPPEVRYLRRSLLAAVEQLHKYGGIFIELPEGDKLRRLARLVGLGDLYEAVTALFDDLDERKFETKSRGLVQDLQLITAESVATLLEKAPLKLRFPPPRE